MTEHQSHRPSASEQGIPQYDYDLSDEEKLQLKDFAQEMAIKWGDNYHGAPTIEGTERGIRVTVEACRHDFLKGVGIKNTESDNLSAPLISSGLITYSVAHKTPGGSTLRETAVFGYDEHREKAGILAYSYFHLS